MSRKIAVRRSMLWAAYADALGFITELADEKAVRRRTSSSNVQELSEWQRRVGGKFGVQMTLPSGCYSDDTQLRLATCRAIRRDGTFDVDAFAKVELPVWRAYALGAGRGTKAAAKSLAKPDVQWSGNFFDQRGCDYINGGGNGAAMRIQPHVWAAPPQQPDAEVMRDIIKNAITTHGHFRGILGAVFHGMWLLRTVRDGAVPPYGYWKEVIKCLQHVRHIIERDEALATFWMPHWELKAGREIAGAIDETIEEMACDLSLVESRFGDQPNIGQYREIVSAVGAFDAKFRGAGTKTAILATYLGCAGQCDPYAAILAAVNTLGSDTDTIATMAGAIAGSVSHADPPQAVADSDYLEMEATRMYAISEGTEQRSFRYPDLLYWQAPKADIDVVRSRDGGYYVAGLGRAEPVGKEVERPGKTPEVWQWLKLYFGQRVLLKRRCTPDTTPESFMPFVEQHGSDGERTPAEPTVDEACRKAVESQFAPGVIGAILLAFEDQSKAVAFASYVVRSKKNHIQRT